MCDEVKEQERPSRCGKGYPFFSNTACEYFPCHPVPDGTKFNRLFCYCPLYALGRARGGNFTYLENGLKDCSRCIIPYQRENYGHITKRCRQILKAVSEQDRSPD